ncbi:hypothetical protein T4B_5518 [Trichinella pseudospiralis]|uniref:Uncharacterized protein n=1 Tax=Trichinella pseudospiralis TaxID=6337 RepID=A0A0V1GR86_TRIPS|nr:hypothetical protein T4B_5518 [Trichinella pseudospiralis]
MEAMMDAVGGCMMSDDHTCGIRQYEEHADFKQFIICGQDLVDWKCSRNVDVNPHLIIYWNSCRCVADRDMKIYYDANDVRRMNNGVFNAMTDEEYY